MIRPLESLINSQFKQKSLLHFVIIIFISMNRFNTFSSENFLFEQDSCFFGGFPLERADSHQNDSSSLFGESVEKVSNDFFDDEHHRSEKGQKKSDEWEQKEINHPPIAYDIKEILQSNPITNDTSHDPPQQPQQNQEGPPSQEQKEKKKRKKNDEMKNLYPNVMKTVINAISNNSRYSQKLKKIKNKESQCNFVDIQEFRSFIIKMKCKDYSLRDIYYYMNYHQGDEKTKGFKKMFNQFFSWYCYRVYPNDVARSYQCENKIDYIEGVNKLVYLPDKREPRSMN